MAYLNQSDRNEGKTRTMRFRRNRDSASNGMIEVRKITDSGVETHVGSIVWNGDETEGPKSTCKCCPDTWPARAQNNRDIREGNPVHGYPRLSN